MKKLLVTLIVSLAFGGSVFAQHPETHWPGFDYHAYETQGALYASLMINGQPVYNTTDNWDQMEVAAFVGDQLRMTAMFLTDEYVIEYGDLFPTLNAEPVYYTTPGETVTFKMYNHATGEEYEECVALIWDGDGAALTILTGEEHWEGLDDPDHPLMLNFISSGPTEPTPWGTEFVEDLPTEADDVTITEDVIIPNGYVAYANEITIEEGATLYIEEGGQLIHNGEVEVTMLMNVVGYGTAKDGNNAGYRLFASPVHSTATNNFIAVEGTNLNTGTFDLYKFDESQDQEWINYKLADNNFTNLDLGTGYLYANEASIDNAVLRGFTVPTTETYAVGTPLTYTTDAEFKGWNLVGNPYTCNAYVKNGSGYMPYYVLNTNGDGIEGTVVAAGTPIAPMKGLFVEASATDQSCIFTTEAPSAKGSLNIMVNQGRGMVDNAILNFGEGSDLEKLQFNPNHTKVYMTQDGKDYAVVSAPEMGEMPVSFKAESNGSYTLSFTAEEVSFNYLHLIDNLTGIETDLLATPSYSFNAQTTDYASRFRLVFATGNNSNDDNFAFFSDGNLVINNEGNATLQVIDVTGRILSSETINGCASLSVNGAAGVYMIRLINGENVKVQKVVVR